MRKKLNEILLIDDDQVNNFITEKLLIKLKIAETITIKSNGREGLNFINQKCISDSPYCPQFIIFDYNMPVMDGLEFLKEINRINFRKDYQVVLLLLAVQIPPHLLKEFVTLGISDYTTKPLDEETVLSVYSKYWNKEGIWIG